jgi:hypothetical protein
LTLVLSSGSRPETSPVASIAELAAFSDREEIITQEPQHSTSTLPLGDAFADLLGFVQTMSEEVNLLRTEVVTLKPNEFPSNEVIDGVRSSYLDLEEIFQCEIAVDDPIPERASKSACVRENKSSKEKKTPVTQKGDVLSRLKSRQPPVASDESSKEGEISSDEDGLPRPDLIGAAVAGLTEQVFRPPEFKTLVYYRVYCLTDTSQKANAVESGKINAQLKRLRLYVDYKFSGDPEIQVLDFLRSFKDAADINE